MPLSLALLTDPLIGPKPQAKQRTQIELKLTDSDSRPNVKVNGIGCSWSKLADPVHIQTSRVRPQEKGQRHIYNVPASAVSEGYNLVEVVAAKDIPIDWVDISVR